MRIPMMEYQLHSRLPWNLRSFMQTLKCTYETICGEKQSKDALFELKDHGVKPITWIVEKSPFEGT